MDDIKFTIAIPAYKSLYLDEAIESIVSQKYVNWELIILDDCSPYDVEGVSSAYVNKDNRIKYYRNTVNVGAVDVVDNWNKCLELSTGDFFLCMGDDDLLSEDCLSVYYKYIKEYSCFDIFHAATEIIDENSDFLNLQEARPLTESVYSMAWHRLLRKRDQYIGDFLFKTKALKSIGGFYKLPLAWSSDDITTYLCAVEKGIINIPDHLFSYRVNRHTISNTGNVLIKLEAIVKEELWYREYLLTLVPQTELDSKYRTLISKVLNPSFSRKRVSTIAFGLSSVVHLYKLVRKRKDYQVSMKEVMLALLLRCYNLNKNN